MFPVFYLFFFWIFFLLFYSHWISSKFSISPASTSLFPLEIASISSGNGWSSGINLIRSWYIFQYFFINQINWVFTFTFSASICCAILSISSLYQVSVRRFKNFATPLPPSIPLLILTCGSLHLAVNTRTGLSTARLVPYSTHTINDGILLLKICYSVPFFLLKTKIEFPSKNCS